MIRRADAVRIVVESLQPDTLVVASLGSASYYLFETDDRPLNLYTFAAMGQASSIALGLAIGCPERPVVVIDGDGSILMNLSILAVIADQSPKRFLHVILNDGAFESTGGQKTLSDGVVSLTGVAQACGIASATEAADGEQLGAAIDAWQVAGGVALVDVDVPSERGDVRPRIDPVYYRYRFKDALSELGAGEQAAR
jgi:phosphonopyruvate decarboxylase